MDRQWNLYVHDKPGPGSTCESKTVDEFTTQLAEIARSHPNQLLLVVLHHPPYTYGPHGGDYGFKQHIFPFTAMNPNLYIPLPILGSIYPITRGIFGNLQDNKHPLYRTMVNAIEDAIKDHPNAMVVSGHDHNLQMIKKDSIPYVVSGAGARLNTLKKGKYQLFGEVRPGCSVIEVWKSGKVDIKFFTLDSKG